MFKVLPYNNSAGGGAPSTHKLMHKGSGGSDGGTINGPPERPLVSVLLRIWMICVPSCGLCVYVGVNVGLCGGAVMCVCNTQGLIMCFACSVSLPALLSLLLRACKKLHV